MKTLFQKVVIYFSDTLFIGMLDKVYIGDDAAFTYGEVEGCNEKVRLDAYKVDGKINFGASFGNRPLYTLTLAESVFEPRTDSEEFNEPDLLFDLAEIFREKATEELLKIITPLTK